MSQLEDMLSVWRRHEKLNHLLLDYLPEDGFHSIPLLKGGKPGRGRSVARVFTHMIDTRMSFMRKAEKAAAGELPLFSKDTSPTCDELAQGLQGSSLAVEARLTAAIECDGLIRKYSPLNFMAYLVSHESHHRGQIMLALKQNGFAVPDAVKWGLWGHWFSS